MVSFLRRQVNNSRHPATYIQTHLFCNPTSVANCILIVPRRSCKQTRIIIRLINYKLSLYVCKYTHVLARYTHIGWSSEGQTR